MRVILSLLLFIPFLAHPCGDAKKSELISFAKIIETNSYPPLVFYEVFVHSKYRDHFLTSIELTMPNSVSVALKASKAFGYDGFDSVSFLLNPELIDVVELEASYSTNEDKTGFSLCGDVMELNFRSMLVAEQPVMVVRPPPPMPITSAKGIR
jgi:hypothetical protein